MSNKVNTEDIRSSPLYSEDLAPVPIHKRTWNTWHLAALWVGMAVCIPTYILASYMIKAGLSWYAALLIICIGNVIITVPMVLNGHAGARYGVPFPVLGRAAFGTKGIHVASLMRAFVACGWFGVQTWIGGLALYAIWNALTGSQGAIDLSIGKFVAFGIFWVINLFFIWKGTESIKWLEEFSAPILLLIGIALLAWGAYSAGAFGLVLEQSKQLSKPSATVTYHSSEDTFYLQLNPLKNADGSVKATHYRLTVPVGNSMMTGGWLPLPQDTLPVKIDETLSGKVNREKIISGEQKFRLQVQQAGHAPQKTIYSAMVDINFIRTVQDNIGNTVWIYLLWLTAMVGFWATMSISIADITRYAVSQKAQVLGQFIGLPGTMVLYSFVGVFVTCAAILNFGDILIAEDAPWDPVSLLSRFENPAVVVFSQFAMIIATLSTNIAANVIAPSNAFSNMLPKKINFKTGGYITGVIGILICPWWLLNEISGILIFISGLLGPVLGILICDYYVIRKKNLSVEDLFRVNGIYRYRSGYNVAAFIALTAGILSALLGYWLHAIHFLYTLSWFTGFLISFVCYGLLMRQQQKVHKTG